MTRLFNNCRIIDGKGGKIEEGFVVIKEDRIDAVGTLESIPGPDADDTIDLTGATILPGLIDAHVHLALDAEPDPMISLLRDDDLTVAYKAARNAYKTLLAGITTVRDVGSRGNIGIYLREAVDAGVVPGPRILTTGKCISMTGGHGWWMAREADGEAEVRKAVREQVKAGADVIKLMATGGVMSPGMEAGAPQFTFEELRAGVEEAHKAGRKVCSHVQGMIGIKNALRAGIDSIEHGVYIDEEALAMFLTNQAYLVPTLSAPHFILANGLESGIPAYAMRKCEQVAGTHFESAKMAHKRGVPIVAGTDAGTPFNKHGENLKELELLCGIGLTPMESIVSATSTAAGLLGLDKEIGTVEAGKTADLIVVRGNPLDDITMLQKPDHILAIIKGGTYYKNLLEQRNSQGGTR